MIFSDSLRLSEASVRYAHNVEDRGRQSHLEALWCAQRTAARAFHRARFLNFRIPMEFP